MMVLNTTPDLMIQMALLFCTGSLAIFNFQDWHLLLIRLSFGSQQIN